MKIYLKIIFYHLCFIFKMSIFNIFRKVIYEFDHCISTILGKNTPSGSHLINNHSKYNILYIFK